jgi:3-oxo-5alpha-steroid 4-dehydrogenase
MSGGYIYTGGGTALQKACGIKDTPENFYNHLIASTGPTSGPSPSTHIERCEVLAKEGVSYFDWMVSFGIPYQERFFDGPCWQIPADYGLTWSGGESAYPFNQLADPAPRAHVAYLPPGSGVGDQGPGQVVMKHLTAGADALGVKKEVDIRVERLVTESDGRIVGVIGRRYGEEIAVKARRGVILTAGGFMNNPEMLAQHTPPTWGTMLTGTEGDDGRGIKMGQAVGGDVQLMDRSEVAVFLDLPLMWNSIVVNMAGDRFVNEDSYGGRVGQHILFRQDGQALMVFDEEKWEAYQSAEGRHPAMSVPLTFACATLEELEKEAGLPAGSLVQTVDYYNKHAVNGDDPKFHKRAAYLKPIKAPYAAIVADKAHNSFGCFTLGGLRANANSEVLHVDGSPIPGLYAAGRTASGTPAWGYLSGTSLGDSIFFGRKAGVSAAAFTG